MLLLGGEATVVVDISARIILTVSLASVAVSRSRGE